MSCHHFKALMKKNILILKRTYILTFFELFSPIIVMLILLLTNSKFETEHKPIYIDNSYIQENCDYISNNIDNTDLCFPNIYYFKYKCQKAFIALIGEDFPEEIENEIKNIFDRAKGDEPKFRNYNDILELKDYIESENYKKMTKVCFGISYKLENNYSQKKYIFKLHFFSSKYISSNKYISNIPPSNIDNLDPFRINPDFDSFFLYEKSGYLMIQKILYDYILKTETGNQDAEILYKIIPGKYEEKTHNVLYDFIHSIISIFILIAYAFPMSINIYRLIKEKESKAKEIMKIMGLNEFYYYLSYFIIYFIINLFHALLNTLIVKSIFNYIEFGYLFGLFFAYGLVIFSLIFFFQSFLEKANISIIFCILVYSIMYFKGTPLKPNAVKKGVKIFFALLFPPINIFLGCNTLTQFQINFNKFNGRTTMNYNNYSVLDMYIIFIFNFVLYMLIGFYLQNVLQHQFGFSKPWNFLCTKKFWGCDDKIKENKNKMKNISLRLSTNLNKSKIKNKYINNNIIPSSKDNINNDIKSEHTDLNEINIGNNQNEKMEIKNIKKYFGEKLVLNGVCFELKSNEIFVLLGHNGAGKTTLISILTGLIKCTSGSAYINNCDLLSPEFIEHFRRILGVCPQHDVLFNDLTVEEHLELFCEFKSYDRSNISSEINKVLRDIGLEDKRTTRAGDLSGGQKRKLSIGLAIVGGSTIIFLDEPTSGMDITSRRNLWDILKKIVQGKIVILTTHFMEEAQILGDRIGILSEGKMQVVGTPLELIDKYTNNVNLNIIKHADANEDKIIGHVLQSFGDLDIYFENFNRNILFRIPTNVIEINWKNFFELLDRKLDNLKIKSYSISKSTLEDVFINFSKIVNKNSKDKIIQNYNINKQKAFKNSVILFNDYNYDENNSDCSKFWRDFKISFMKRIKQIIRDKKTFILEIVCPILLTIIGCLVGYIEFLEENKTFPFHLNQITNETQIIYYNNNNDIGSSITNYIRYHESSEDLSNIKFEDVNFPFHYSDSDRYLINKIDYIYNLRKQNDAKSFVYYDLFQSYENQHQYGFNLIIDIISRQAAPIYANYLFNEVVHYATRKENLNIEMINEPLPYTYEERKNKKSRNQFMILFFISLAFSLIPSNFITIIIKERENNSKHLQIISGISLFGYWFNNYIFELIKYYFIGGICLLLLLAFDFYEKYLYILYLEYGPPMISFTYVFSVLIKSEYIGQITILLLNLIFGTIFGIAVIIMRLYDKLIDFANDLSCFLRIIPSFCFCYGYNQLLNRENLFSLDKDIKSKDSDLFLFYTQDDIDDNILLMKHIGADCIYLAIESLFYLLILVILENNLNKNCIKHNVDLNSNEFRVNPDHNLQQSRMILNREQDKNYAIEVKNLVKIYYNSCGKEHLAVRNISFKLEEGEIFGFLGTNGAGKTTSFKCLSNEIIPTVGSIKIKDYDITKDFNKVRNLIGYCPQFDTIFEYLTVYENLEFYGLVKGAKKSNLDNIINALIEEMNLVNFKDKISGTLSGGNKRKLSVAIALICNPPIILLDEPSTGMDPEARRHMWKAIYNVSLNRKKSSIIMTTHSMEEAESLCKTIGILVNGQFKCLGTSDEIKDTFGYGFEINLQIKEPDTKALTKIFKLDSDDLDKKITINSFDEDMTKYNLQKYKNQIFNSQIVANSNISNNPKLFGDKLYDELINNSNIKLKKILLWIYYSKCALGFIKLIKDYFDKITCVNYKDNNYIFRIKRKRDNNEKSIGFLFGFIEENIKKDNNKFNIAQYNLQYSTLEQIFNSLANPDENNEENHIEISKELLDCFYRK